MIKEYTLLALQKAINHALALDESTPDKIDKLTGKIVEVIISLVSKIDQMLLSTVIQLD